MPSSTSDLLTPDPRNRSLLAATRAAVRRTPNLKCNIRLRDGTTHGFIIVEVLDDALLGCRKDAPDKACLLQIAAIAMIEFG